jgi:hypothetical protein
MDKRQPLYQKEMGKLDTLMQKSKTRSLSFTLYKINSKQTEHFSISSETLKLLEENTGDMLQHTVSV